MKEMVDHISKEAKLKKSPLIAKALAKDFEKFTASHVIALESESKRKDPSSTPSQFIRATCFKVSWYIFFTRKEAEEFLHLLKSTIDIDPQKNSKVVEIIRDFGVLEILKILLIKGSDFEHTKKVYDVLSKSIKFGL